MAIKQFKGVIDDGTREISLVNKFGKLICKIHIRPSDFSILDRLGTLQSDMPKILKPLKNIGIRNDGTATFEQDWQLMKSVEVELYKRIDELFDMDEANEIFAKRNPFSSVGGRFFCEIVIETIGNLIVDAVNEEMELSKARTDKYLKDVRNEVKDDAGPTATDD